LRSDDQSSLLSKTRESLISIDEWNEYTIEAGLADVLGSLEAPNYYFGLLRKALTGQENCPPIFPSMAALGKENTLHRIERTVQLLR
jgi:glutamyl/glutaminyl-tRNA synthetase